MQNKNKTNAKQEQNECKHPEGLIQYLAINLTRERILLLLHYIVKKL